MEIGDAVVIRSKGHRKDGETGYIQSTPAENTFMGTYGVVFSGDPSRTYGFMPSEVFPA